ncbi:MULTISPECIES: hypothetical protein [Streptacidiphilus]|uniref:Uncharacterized protein n=1 Tax=Streptacidiphilus cavernicola TaxID=3342716 RepID=A0ABV6UNE8_9ACTN|nr:hypothetical protein [Streptacidiphilus jeojiense]
MTDYTVRELMDKALEGLLLPGEDITESVLAQASHRQRRRRSVAVAASAAGLATVAGLAVLLPQVANGATDRKPGPATLTAPPVAATHPTATRPAVDPASVVAGLLPAGSGRIVKIKDEPPTPAPPGTPAVTVWPTSRLAGTYLIVRNGRTAAVVIQSYDPKARPVQRSMGGDISGVCNETPATWNCKESNLPGGVQVIETTEPAGAWAQTAGVVSTVSVSYPDGRFISVDAMAGTGGLRDTSFGPGWATPPLDRAQLLAFTENPVWFR